MGQFRSKPEKTDIKIKINNFDNLVKKSSYKNRVIDVNILPPECITPSKKQRIKLIDNLTCDSFIKKIKNKSTKVINSNDSASQTGQLIANEIDDEDSNQIDLNQNKIFVKLFAQVPQNTTYFVEAMIYNEIIPILLANSTPFLVSGINSM